MLCGLRLREALVRSMHTTLHDRHDFALQSVDKLYMVILWLASRPLTSLEGLVPLVQRHAAARLAPSAMDAGSTFF